MLRGLFMRLIFSASCFELLRWGFFQIFGSVHSALVDSGSFQASLLLDPLFDPTEGSSSLSSSSLCLLNETVSP
ncbi:hypothetical protein Tco_1010603 [Tanacetum coccineum]